jgi:hypothetical protein
MSRVPAESDGPFSPFAAAFAPLEPTLIALQPGRTHRPHHPRSDEGVVAKLFVVECDGRNVDDL